MSGNCAVENLTLLVDLLGPLPSGDSVVIESPDGVQLKRNNTHVKKYEERIVGQGEKTTLPVDLEPTESATEQQTAKFPLLIRPCRVTKLPEKFKDFVMT